MPDVGAPRLDDPHAGEPRIPRLALWAIYATVIASAILCLMAAVVFMASPPP